MTDDIELTRRRLLASVGTVGLASAGAGLGTTAYFGDRESFDGNTLAAGELDLTVDWQEHYYDAGPNLNNDRLDDPGGDESDADLDDVGVDDFEIVRTGGDPTRVPAGYVGFPTVDAPQVAVPEAFVDDFLANTAVEAFPDTDGDGIQDLILTRDQISAQYPTLSPSEVEATFHDQFADVPQDLDAPVLDICDVKPGDFGEVTFSVHLHDSPGLLWLRGALHENAENGIVEPEAATDSTAGDGELLEAIRAVAWHDDGDNLREATELVTAPHDVNGPTAVELDASSARIVSGSLGEVLTALSSGHGVPLDADPTTSGRTCFPNSTTRYVGFAWWLPIDTGNAVQTDSVRFDLGFYTEQCHDDADG